MKTELIYILREKYGLSQNDIAHCLQLERSHVNMIEKGKRSIPTKAMSEIPLIFPIKSEEYFKSLEADCRKKPFPLLNDERYEQECEHLYRDYEIKLRKLDKYHAQYAALKEVYEKLLITAPTSGWRYKVEERMKKISKHLGPEREIARLAMEFFKKEKKMMGEKRERDKEKESGNEKEGKAQGFF